MSDELQTINTGIISSKNSAAELVQKIPPEAIGQVVVTAATAAARVLETQELSAARRREVENQIELLRATTDSDIQKMEVVVGLLSDHIELLSPDERSELITTICQLAAGRGSKP